MIIQKPMKQEVALLITNMIKNNATKEEIMRATEYSISVMDCTKMYDKLSIHELEQKYLYPPHKNPSLGEVYERLDLPASEEDFNIYPWGIRRIKMSDVKKKYYVYNCGSEGYSTGTIFLTEAEAELINRVSNKKNWDTVIDDDDYDGSTHVELVKEEK